uniref:Secreted protein n=1 Tax=Rousettus aegyptiacus TaxID=9407 RepID=A0A7J8CHN7_ROUAE|nr:hypothetical protein HJG63_008965 [Rousettus aegyptiacus]
MAFMAHFFFVLSNIPSSECTAVYPLTYGGTSWLLQVLVFMNKAAMYTSVCSFFFFSPCRHELSTHLARSLTAGSYGKSVLGFVSDQQTAFRSSGTIPHSQHPPRLHTLTSIWWSAFQVWAILRGAQWYPVVLICISLMAHGVRHLFMCSFTICVSSLVRSV